MLKGICPTCGTDLEALTSRLESEFLRDPVGVTLELSAWAAKPPGKLGRVRSRLRQKGLLEGKWWDDMTCKQRTRFLKASLIPQGFQVLFPEPVLTHVVHSEWERLNRHMRGELQSIRG